MFRKRPPEGKQPDTNGWAQGLCFWADQSALQFGQNRREPVSSRPAVSLQKRGDRYLVLPGTSQFDPDFFHLRPDDYFVIGKPNTSLKDTYLFYEAESLAPQALTRFATLSHPCRVRIISWLHTVSGRI